ncbi:MAG: hypothetical protein ACTSWI_00150 [Alphaproteobacteria bacterium]
MIWHPRPGQRVRLWYAKRYAAAMPHHGRLGIMVVAGRGLGPINALVRLDDGPEVVVPRGNLQEANDE